MLDVIVLIAMAVTATAFAAGLTVHSGVAMIPSVIAGAALYLVMAASYLMISRQTKATPVATRLQELEEAMEIIDSDLQRIDRVEDDVARLDLLNDRVERLDQAVGTISGGEYVGGGLPRNDDFAAEFEQVHARIEGLRADLEGEARNQRDKIAGDLRALEGLINQLSRELSVTAAAAAKAEAAAQTAPATAPSRVMGGAEPGRGPVEEIASETVAVYDLGAADEGPLLVQEEVVQEEVAELPTGSLLEQAMLTVLNDAIEGGRVDLYLQPIVTLPERKLRYYEGADPPQDHRRRDRDAARLSSGRRERRLDADRRQRAAGQERAAAPPPPLGLPRQGRVLQYLGAVAARSRLLPRAGRVHGGE